MLRLHTETACRRAGALALRPDDLDPDQCLIRLREKGETVRWQPVSPTLMGARSQYEGPLRKKHADRANRPAPWPRKCSVIGTRSRTGGPTMRMFRKPQFVLDSVGLIIALGLFIASAHTRSPIRDILVGVGASFIFVALLDLLLVAQRKTLQRERAGFFGHELVHDRTTLVYPDFVMHDAVCATLKKLNQQMLYQRPASRFPNLTTHRIDMPRAVAANDIEALLYVADTFESTPACPNVMLVDRAVVDQCDRSFISFGLSSNDCTHLYIHEHSHRW